MTQSGDDTLPIDDVREEFLATLDGTTPTITVAPTGSGKSTRLPIWMEESLDGPMLVVEPRRVACRSLAGYLASQRGEEAGESIGYRVRFDDCTSDRTRVIFATTGVALRMLGSDDPWPFAGVVVDEFHERGWEVDLVVAILQAKADEPEFGPLVLTSATIEAGRLARQLEGDLVEAEGRTHPVDIAYRGDPPAPSARDLADRVSDAVADVVESPDDDGGDILVFLPGKGEISDCDRALQGLANAHDLEVLEVHGRLPPSRMARAFDEDVDRRRVFLATNVAETSVTLPGVTTVIDSGLVKMKIHRGGRSALALVATSKDSMDQRAGRAGRVQPGRCIRLWSERFRPDETTSPEIERIELDEVLLHAASCGLEGDTFDEAPWVDDPPAFAIENARARLQAIGALDDRGHLTSLGRRLSELPVDAHDARMLVDPPDDLKGTLADLVALLQRSTDLVLSLGMLSGSQQGDVRHHRNQLFKQCDHEPYTQITALRRGEPDRHGLHRSAWHEARKVSASLRDMIDAPASHPGDDDADLPDVERLGDYLLERLPEFAFVLRERALDRRIDGKPKQGYSEPWANGEVELDVYPFRPPVDPKVRSKELDYPVAGLILDLFWLGDQEGTGVRGKGSMLLPATYDQLADAGLGERIATSVRLKGQSGGVPRIVGTVERQYAGVTLRREQRKLEGRRLCEAVAELVLEGRLFDGAAETIRDDLHLWHVFGEWPAEERWWAPVETSPPDPEVFVADTLWELGLRESDDMMLLEADDLRPDLTEHLGVAQYKIDEWREEFPRTWSHMGRAYRCEVQPSAEKVFLEPDNAKARKGDDPNARHLPRFKGFSVYFRNASRVVPIRP